MTQTGGTLKVQVSGPNNSVTLLTAASFQGSKTAANDLDAYAAAATKYSTATSANSSALLTAYTNAANKLIADIQNNACQALGQGCFAAGTKLWTPQGYRNVEDIQPGDLVYARDENDPAAPVVVRVVEERFERTGNVLHLHVAGELIRTTPEHPFYVFRKGWTQAGALVEGDWISTLAGGWVVVEELYDTGLFEAVYNVRVAEYHTYFVGEEGWGFGVWAHNTYGYRAMSLAEYAQVSGTNPVWTDPPGGTVDPAYKWFWETQTEAVGFRTYLIALAGTNAAQIQQAEQETQVIVKVNFPNDITTYRPRYPHSNPASPSGTAYAYKISLTVLNGPPALVAVQVIQF